MSGEDPIDGLDDETAAEVFADVPKDWLRRQMTLPAPFLKWAGGKRQLLPELKKALPSSFGKYYEPFVGGGALFFELRRMGMSGQAVLTDVNRSLIRGYMGVRDSVEEVIRALQKMRYDKDEYLKRRRVDPATLTSAGAAAWLIYTNRCRFNGLWRVNKKGQFNVPFGRHTNPTICNAEVLRSASMALQYSTEIESWDFDNAADAADRGDLVYFDPPYVPLSESSDFTRYTRDGFTLADQTRLRDCALALKRRGVHVVLSNSDTTVVRRLYARDFSIRRVEAVRAINSKADRRGAVGELIIT